MEISFKHSNPKVFQIEKLVLHWSILVKHREKLFELKPNSPIGADRYHPPGQPAADPTGTGRHRENKMVSKTLPAAAPDLNF
jgi:hypothetical protein